MPGVLVVAAWLIVGLAVTVLIADADLKAIQRKRGK